MNIVPDKRYYTKLIAVRFVVIFLLLISAHLHCHLWGPHSMESIVEASFHRNRNVVSQNKIFGAHPLDVAPPEKSFFPAFKTSSASSSSSIQSLRSLSPASENRTTFALLPAPLLPNDNSGRMHMPNLYPSFFPLVSTLSQSKNSRRSSDQKGMSFILSPPAAHQSDSKISYRPCLAEEAASSARQSVREKVVPSPNINFLNITGSSSRIFANKELFSGHTTAVNALNTLQSRQRGVKLSKLYSSDAGYATDEDRLKAVESLAYQTPLTSALSDASWDPKETPLLEVEDLYVESVDEAKKILHGISLKLYQGQRVAIMGRNGSGKSTLSKVIAGHPAYRVTSGNIKYKGLDLLDIPVDIRGISGIFLAFQYPIEIPIVKNSEFLRAALNERRILRNEPEMEPLEFNMLMFEKLQQVGLDADFMDRPLNYGFSGGEKKRNEILQMLILNPDLCLLDETDSGLDVDSFRLTADTVKNFGSSDKTFLIVTHYKKLLDLLEPSIVHVMHKGKIVASGGLEIASQLEYSGFGQFIEDDD